MGSDPRPARTFWNQRWENYPHKGLVNLFGGSLGPGRYWPTSVLCVADGRRKGPEERSWSPPWNPCSRWGLQLAPQHLCTAQWWGRVKIHFKDLTWDPMCLFSAVPEIDRGQNHTFVSDPGSAKSQKEKWSAVLQRLSPFRAHRLMSGTGNLVRAWQRGKSSHSSSDPKWLLQSKGASELLGCFHVLAFRQHFMCRCLQETIVGRCGILGGQKPQFYRGSVDSKDEDEAVIALPLRPTESFTVHNLVWLWKFLLLQLCEDFEYGNEFNSRFVTRQLLSFWVSKKIKFCLAENMKIQTE